MSKNDNFVDFEFFTHKTILHEEKKILLKDKSEKFFIPIAILKK